jgi:protein-tyrosine-phosphatase
VVQPALFVCTGNSARSQLAAALWTAFTDATADSAGTHPADRVHPGAVAAGRRAGLDLSDATPRSLDDLDARSALTITVCDRAHEELDPGADWLHWSIPDPVPTGTRVAFDATVTELRRRITDLVGVA